MPEAKGAELRRLEYDLVEMKADINARENSPEAIRRFAEESDRRGRMGLYPGWSLDMNPTVGHADDRGLTRNGLIESVPMRMQSHADRWIENEAARAESRKSDPWLPRSNDGSIYQLGGDRESGLPGARVQWTDRMWHWTAWDGQGNLETNLTEQRSTAQSTAQSKAIAFAKEHNISYDYLLRRQALPEVPGVAGNDEPEQWVMRESDLGISTESPSQPIVDPRDSATSRHACEAAQGPLTPPKDAPRRDADAAQPEVLKPSGQRNQSRDHRRDGGRSL